MKNDKWIIITFIIYIILIILFYIFMVKAVYSFDINEQAVLIDYIMDTNKKISQEEVNLISSQILEQSRIDFVSWELITAIIKVESHFDRYAVSEKDARGLMQIYTLECNNVKIDKNRLFEIEYNIACGICILKEKIKQSNDNIELAIMLYNGRGEITKEYLKEVKKTLKDIIKRINNRKIAYEKSL